eukprot:gene15950-8240_t
MEARAARVTLVRPLLHPRSRFSEKMFAAWAPRVATAVLRGAVLADLPDVPRPPPERGQVAPHAAPVDEWAAQRRAYHAELVDTFSQSARFCVPAGDAAAWAEALARPSHTEATPQPHTEASPQPYSAADHAYQKKRS